MRWIYPMGPFCFGFQCIAFILFFCTPVCRISISFFISVIHQVWCFLLVPVLQVYNFSVFIVCTSTEPFCKILAELPMWFPDGSILLLLATFEAVCQPGPLSETNKLSSVYCISFQAALSTLNLALFQSNQNPISPCANSICFISRRCYAEKLKEFSVSSCVPNDGLQIPLPGSSRIKPIEPISSLGGTNCG